MESLVKELENTEVLSKKDIITLKSYIHKKYNNFSNNERAKILSNTIHQILDKSIKGLKIDYYNAIKNDLIKSLITSTSESSIKLIDILNKYLSLQDSSYEYSEDVLNWVTNHVNTEFSKSELNAAFNLNFPVEPQNKLETQSHYESTAIVNAPEPLHKNIIALILSIMIFIVILLSIFIIKYNPIISKTQNISKNKSSTNSKVINKNITDDFSKLPSDFKYKSINTNSLRHYLNTKNSLLAFEPYFSKIIRVCKNYNLNPLLLFAITGQEQAFVPIDAPKAKQIANNPFNVYHSWKEYNTSIEDSTKIAAKTIINECSNLPQNTDPFHWLNKSYAEDPSWGAGVESLFKELQKNN
ncbi:glucosaminidase domain-containing protein [Clostridium felsineum]|uniref:hypothetical protein n=1 Tax=Clostridium felsineum TaxID=36839 RepID=UPI00214D9927|nr:hypothetical protein [Clostridium felsineum]MCR3759975.1 glucosaminidase domain-containing protein [Clostridium felsineum]